MRRQQGAWQEGSPCHWKHYPHDFAAHDFALGVAGMAAALLTQSRNAAMAQRVCSGLASLR